MDRASRSELLRTVEEQQEKITKYQTKLRDLVAAYKGVLKEKAALEQSLQILGNGGTRAEHRPPLVGAEGEDRTEVGGIETPSEGSESEVLQLKDQLVTLTSSMATLTQEKSKMEANYQAEKKALRQEYEDRESRYEEDLSQLHSTVDDLEQQVASYKSKLREQQHEREKEQNDHGIMLRELQTLMSAERHGKEQLEAQLEEVKFELEEQKSIPRLSADQHTKEIKALERVIDGMKAELKQHKEAEATPNTELTDMQEQLHRIKVDHHESLSQERDRLVLSQKMLHEVSTQGEQRISSLEAKNSSLSKSVGDYERLRFHDQQTIAKLRERVTQLDLENTALAKATQANTEPEGSGGKDADVADLVEQISTLVNHLVDANDRADQPVPIAELLTLCELDERADLHASCRREFETLREEFERYKLRAQSVLKSKSSKDMGVGNKEVEELKGAVADLKERLWQVRADRDDLEVQHRQKEENLSKALVAVQEKQREELAGAQAEHQLKMAELNTEMKRHRERTIALLAEKDRELESMRQRSPEYAYRQSPHSTSSDQDLLEGGASSEADPVVHELLNRSSLLSGAPGETTLLHFAQEQARKDVEINSLRKHKHGLETALRELQHSSVVKEEQYCDQIDLLKEEIRKNERNKSRENANLEYLKNVVYKYMVCTETVGRQQMLNAISTILEFSPREKKAVHDHIHAGWWSYGTQAPKNK